MAQPQRRPNVSAAPRVNALGAYVRQRLDDLGMTRTAFGAAVGLSRSSVYRLLSDHTPPERLASDRIEIIAGVLDVDPDALTALWDGHIYAVMDATREDIVRGFVLATGDLTDDELRHTLDVARAAAHLTRRRQV